MLKKTISYVDYNGDTRQEDFWFNLTKSELAMLDLSTAGGMRQRLQKVVDANDKPALIAAFKDILKACYGVKSEDGRRFIKSDELYEEFEQTPAFDVLFMELCSGDGKAAAEFAKGILPPDLLEEVEKEEKKVLPIPESK